mgnify:CR=1 FL=1
MIGMMTWTPPAGGVRQKSVALETRALLHLRVAWASVARGPRTPEALVRRRVLTAAKRLRKAGVTRLVVPEAFAYGEQLEKVGVAPVSTLPLRRALAADLARAVMAGRNLSGGSARLAVAGDQLSGELVRTVTELALGNRYVLLDVPYGGDTLANQLRREYGVSLLLSPTRQQMEEADVLVLFAARTDLRRRDPAVLRLYDEAAPLPPLLLPPVLTSVFGLTGLQGVTPQRILQNRRRHRLTFSNPHTIILLYDNIASLCAGAAASAALPKDRRDTVHMEREYKMSAARAQELKEELNYLKTTRSDEVAEQIKVARGFGDLSENSEYDEAKNEQGKLYSRIAELEEILQHVVIVDESNAPTNVVTIGCKVTVADKNGNTMPAYRIVGSQESDPMNGIISEESPFGKALVGAKEGDTVTVEAPSGAIVYTVQKIER